MIETLYPIFRKWSERGSVYIISDTHFEDKDRKVMGYKITEEDQIKKIKKRCHKNDTLIHLGDVGNPEYLKDIKAYKILIMGNHDESASKFQKKTTMVDLDAYSEEEIDLKLESGEIDYVLREFRKPFIRGYKVTGYFDEVYTGPLFIAEKLLLSHEPIEMRGSETNLPIAINIHGHNHAGPVVKDEWHFNVAQNVYGYEPLNLKEFIKEGYLRNVKSVHRDTIDKATTNKKHKHYNNHKRRIK